ncbi:MAG: gamma carbonic anhydrase family protein [Deltaproteobacteria bacterium]|nr:gamma carbonic anhydrase family protein [Deltaproteobacteria bacterium]
MIRPFRGKSPIIPPSAYVDASAVVIGDVTLGERASIWCNVVARGDVDAIRIGDETNIQDLSCLHVLGGKFALDIGARVTVGHHVVLHGCTVEDGCLIGMGAILLDGCRIGAGSLVAAGSLVTPGTVIPPGSMVVGSPARVKRPVNDAERELLIRSAQGYVENARAFAEDAGSR